MIVWSATMLGVGVLAFFRPYEDNVLLATMMFSVPLLVMMHVVSEKRKYVGRLSDSRTG